jgi:hypothetical protein
LLTLKSFETKQTSSKLEIRKMHDGERQTRRQHKDTLANRRRGVQNSHTTACGRSNETDPKKRRRAPSPLFR